jgi:hypothetical protein
MGYLRFSVPSTGTINGIKFVIATADVAEANDRYDVVTPAGQLLEIDEASDTSLWSAAGASFTTTGIESWNLTTASLTAGFPDNVNTSLYSDTTKTTAIAGSAVALGEGAYSVDYNNDDDGGYRLHLHIPTTLAAIDTLADAVINCQCNCETTAASTQKYVKARAYFDLLTYKANTAANEADRAEVQTMLTTLSNFLGGTDELCGTC